MNTPWEALPTVWEWVWHTSLHVCVIVCVIRIAQLSLRRVLTPRWQYALWMLVLVRMVMPVGLETLWSVYNLFRTVPAPVVVESTPMPVYTRVFETMAEPVYMTSAPLPMIAEPEQTTDWALVAALAWLAGMVMLSLHLLLQWRRLRKIIALGSEVRDASLRELTENCARALGLKYIPTIVECGIDVPGLYGFLRPKLLMPQGLAGTLDAREQRFILLHELSHAKRRDLPVNWLMTVLQVLHWFNPLVWYAFMRMRTDRELACDALALSCAGADESAARPDETQTYGKTLLKLMDANHGLRPTPGMIGILENHAHLKRRIVAIAQFTTRSYKWSIPALIVLSLVAATTLTQAVQEDESSASQDSQSQADVTESESTVDDSEVAEDDTLAQAEVDSNETVQNGEDGGTLRMRHMLGGPAFTYLSNDGMSEDHPLMRRTKVEFDGVELDKAIALLASAAQIHVIAGTEIKGTVSPNWKDIRLGEAIENLLYSYDYGIVEESGVYRVLTLKDARSLQDLQRQGMYPRSSRLMHGERAAEDDPLRQEVDIDFEEMKLKTAVNLLTEKGDIEYTLGEGASLEGSVTAELENIPLGQATEIILRMNGLGIIKSSDTWVIDDYADIAMMYLEQQEQAAEESAERLEEVMDDIQLPASDPDSETLARAEQNPPQGETQDVQVGGAIRIRDAQQGEEDVEEPKSGLQNVQVGGSIRIRKTQGELPEPSEKMKSVLETEIALHALRGHVRPLLKGMGKKYGFTVVVDSDVVAPEGAEDASGYASDGVIRYVNLENVALGDALLALLKPLGLAPMISGETILVTTPERALALRMSPVTTMTPPQKGTRIDDRLDESTWVKLPDRHFHLEEFLEAFREATELNVVVDKRLVAPMPGSGEEAADTVITDGMLRNEWKFRDVPAREILSTVLTRLGLVYSVQPGFLWITSPENVRHESFDHLETRYYALDAEWAERLAPGGNADSLIKTLGLFAPAILEPLTGNDLSFMRYDAAKKQLTVHHTPSNHWRIEQWLKQTGPIKAADVTVHSLEPDFTYSVKEPEAEPQSESLVEPQLPKEPEPVANAEPSFILELDGWNVKRISARDAYVGDLLERVAAERGYTVKIEEGIVEPKDARSADGYHTDGRFFAEQRGGVVTDALENAFKQLDLACVLRDGEMFVTTTLRAADIFHQLPLEVHDAGSVRLYTWRVIDKMFYSGPGAYLKEGTHVQDFLEDLARRNAVVNYLVDPRAVIPPNGKKPKWIAEDPVTDGIIRMSKRYRGNATSRRSMLEDILPTLGLTWSVHHDFIWITTPELLANEAREDVFARRYDVSGIRDGDWHPNFGKLGVDYQSRMNTLMPSVFNEDGRAKTFQLYRGGDFRDLLVVQTPSNHARLQAWLLRQGLDAEPRVTETGVKPAAKGNDAGGVI